MLNSHAIILITQLVLTLVAVAANNIAPDSAAVAACAGITNQNVIKCLDDGSRYVHCNGDNSISLAVAAGQVCKNGMVIAATSGDSLSDLAGALKSLAAAGTALAPRKSAAATVTQASATSSPAPTKSSPAYSPASTGASPAQSKSSAAPDACPSGGQVLATDMQDDSCTGAEGSIECRTEYMYVRCNVGTIPRCRVPTGRKCYRHVLVNTFQA